MLKDIVQSPVGYTSIRNSGSKMLPLRLTEDEWNYILQASKETGISVSNIFRQGAVLFIQKRNKCQIVPPKTEGSIRSIPLGPVLCEILSGYYQASVYQKADDFIFCKQDGSPLHPDVIRKDVLYPILDRLGIERHPRESGFHAFRHCAGSFVNHETGNLKLAQSLLGHSNLSTTADIYTHNFTEAERQASESLEKLIFKNLFQAVPSFKTENRNSVN